MGGNQRVFISPDHERPALFLGGRLNSHKVHLNSQGEPTLPHDDLHGIDIFFWSTEMVEFHGEISKYTNPMDPLGFPTIASFFGGSEIFFVMIVTSIPFHFSQGSLRQAMLSHVFCHRRL